MDESVVEGGEDTGNAENELACFMRKLVSLMVTNLENIRLSEHTVTGKGAEGDVLLGSGSLLGSHCDCVDGVVVDGIWKRGDLTQRQIEKQEKVGVCPRDCRSVIGRQIHAGKRAADSASVIGVAVGPKGGQLVSSARIFKFSSSSHQLGLPIAIVLARIS